MNNTLDINEYIFDNLIWSIISLYFYKKIINEAFNFLADNGMIFLEIGYDQKEELTKLIKADKRYELVKTKKDLGDNDRIVVVKKV